MKPSALYDDLKAEGAVFEEVFGWERPRWFAPEGVAPKDIYGFRRTALDDIVEAELRAVRERAGIMDISAFTKVEVAGPDAALFLDGLIPNRLPSAPGRIALTHLLTESGRIELEMTVVRLAEDRFYLVCAAFFEQRLVDYLTFARQDEDIEILNLSADWGAMALNGPRARDILAACASADLSNAGFKWLTAQEIDVAGRRLWAFRMSYAGELGWEIHCAPESAPAIWDAVTAAGAKPFGTSSPRFARSKRRAARMAW